MAVPVIASSVAGDSLRSCGRVQAHPEHPGRLGRSAAAGEQYGSDTLGWIEVDGSDAGWRAEAVLNDDGTL